MLRIPVDSAEAAELREIEAEQESLEVEHRRDCRNGWLGEDADDRPVPCPWCKPNLYDALCSTCSRRLSSCTALQHLQHRSCCDACMHRPVPTLAELLARVRTHR